MKEHNRFLLAAFVFLVCGAMGIVFQEPLLLIIPFAWLLFPLIFEYCVRRTENLFWLLLLALPFSTELNVTSSLGIDFPDELILMLLTGMTIVKLAHEPKWFPTDLKKQPLFLVVILMMVWSFVSACYADDTILSMKFFLARTWYIIPFVLLPQIFVTGQARITKMALLLIIPMLLLAIQILIRYSFYGFAFEDVKKTMYPFFRNHVAYSSMLVCLLPVAWFMYRLTPADDPKRKWILTGLVIGITGLFFAYSRGAWLALLVGIGFAWIIRKNLLKKLVLFFILLLMAGTSWLVTDYHYLRFAPDHDHTIFHTDFSEHMAATVTLKDVSNAERFYRWVAGFRMFVERPVTGFGPNSFYKTYKSFTVERFKTWVSDNPEHSTVHNYFLLTLLEQGFPGLLLFCCLYFGMLFKVQKLYNQLQRRFYRVTALTIGVILAMIGVVNSMSDMIETDKIGSLFWLCLGILFVLDNKLREEKTAIA